MKLMLMHHDGTQSTVDIEGFMEELVSPQLLERQETGDALDLAELEGLLKQMTIEELTRFRAGTRRTADLAERMWLQRSVQETS